MAISKIDAVTATDNTGMVLLNTTTISSSTASVIWNSTLITTTYSDYMIRIHSCEPVDDGARLSLFPSIDNGSNFVDGNTQGQVYRRITNSSGNITISSTDTDTNFFQKSGSNISPLNTSDNLLLGTTSNPNNRKLLVNGNLESSIAYSAVFASNFGLTDSSFNIQISSAISGRLRIGAAETNRVVEIYNGGYLITFPSRKSKA